MLATLKLLLPALLPSWRFFDSVGPSPRIEYLLDRREFRPPPLMLPVWRMLARLVWNPQRNESLFLTSCAERLMENPTAHSANEISARVGAPWRVVVVRREGEALVREVAAASPGAPA
jgi:hypothetical protein